MWKFDNYSASLRPINKGWQQVGSDALPIPYDRSLLGLDGIPLALSATQLGTFQAGNVGFREKFRAIFDLHNPILEFSRCMIKDFSSLSLNKFGSGYSGSRSIFDSYKSFRMEQLDLDRFSYNIRKNLGDNIRMHLEE